MNFPDHECSYYQMKIDGEKENCPCTKPEKILDCMCEHSQCDHKRECSRPGGRGWIQYLGSVCDNCYWFYPAEYRKGPGPEITEDDKRKLEEVLNSSKSS